MSAATSKGKSEENASSEPRLREGERENKDVEAPGQATGTKTWFVSLKGNDYSDEKWPIRSSLAAGT